MSKMGLWLQFCCFPVAVLVLAACRKDQYSVSASPSSVPRDVAVEMPPRCNELSESGFLTVGKTGSSASRGVDQPFGVEVGEGVSHPGGFAVTLLHSDAQGTEGLVALIGLDSSSPSRSISLGRTFGHVNPPRLAARGEELVVALPDNDASNAIIRIGKIDLKQTDPMVVWGASLRQGRDDSLASAIAIGSKGGLVAWDEWDQKKNRGTIRGARFTLADPSKVILRASLSPPESDAEVPRLVARVGGYWLAWLAVPPDITDDKTGQRVIEIVPLDQNGVPAGTPEVLNSTPSSISSFDLAALPDGTAVVSWREIQKTNVAGGHVLRLLRVSPDGTREPRVIENKDMGFGVPTLTPNAVTEPSKLAAWLSIEASNGNTRFAGLDVNGDVLEPLADSPITSNAVILAARERQLLIARPNGLAMDLLIVQCQPRPKANQ